MSILHSSRQLLAKRVPAWLNVEVNRQFWPNLQAALVPPAPMPVDASLQGRPHWRRISGVYQVLDQVWADKGATTYAILIAHVEEETGVKCSKKLISKWKLERKLRCGGSPR